MMCSYLIRDKPALLDPRGGRRVTMDSKVRTSFFSIANLLSLARIPLAMLFAVSWVAPWGGRSWALAVLLVAAATDALDGMFARRAAARAALSASPAGSAPSTTIGRPDGRSYDMPEMLAVQTPAGTGSWLDPICDKIFVATVLGTIWLRQRPPLGLLALILARELAQLPLSLLYVSLPTLRKWLRYDFRASVLGKAATVSQFAAIASLVMGASLTPALARVSFVTGMLALVDYLWRAVRIGSARLHAHPAAAAKDDADVR